LVVRVSPSAGELKVGASTETLKLAMAHPVQFAEISQARIRQ